MATATNPNTRTDGDWLRRAFLLPPSQTRRGYSSGQRLRYPTSAEYKFTNASLGGNFAINNPPQFTRNADVRYPGIGRTAENADEGMGRAYSEMFDDPKQIVHMTFGVPRFNTWFNFLNGFYDAQTARLVNTGRGSRTMYEVGLVGGFIVSLPLQPFILGASMVSRVTNFLQGNRPSKWYYFKPSMHTYWSAVNTIANELSINMGITPRVFSGGADSAFNEDNAEVDPGEFNRLYQMAHLNMPDLFRPGGGIDVMALANRSQRIANNQREQERLIASQVRNIDALHGRMRDYVNSLPTDPEPGVDAREYFYEAVMAEGEIEDDDRGTASESFSEWSDLEGVGNFLKANLRKGAHWASFRVNHRGAVSESFSNSTTDSAMVNTLNAKANRFKSINFSTMGFGISRAVQEAGSAFASFADGLLDSVQLGGLSFLWGSAFIDAPKHWEDSTANLPRAEYTIPLYSPYGNKLSRFINMYIPIAMILAGGLPLSTGRSSYGSPFLCQIMHQGRVLCQLGMIDSITITRGSGNVGWNAENEMLGAEISFSVIDLSNVLHVPVKGAFGGGSMIGTAASAATLQQVSLLGTVTTAIRGEDGSETTTQAMGLTTAATGAVFGGATWDEQSTFSDYMAVLGGLPPEDIFYARRRLNLNMTRTLQAFQHWKSPSNFMSQLMDMPSARALQGLAQTTDRF
jgi:hypothetical protein